jgi:hypothetical protein
LCPLLECFRYNIVNRGGERDSSYLRAPNFLFWGSFGPPLVGKTLCLFISCFLWGLRTPSGTPFKASEAPFWPSRALLGATWTSFRENLFFLSYLLSCFLSFFYAFFGPSAELWASCGALFGPLGSHLRALLCNMDPIGEKIFSLSFISFCLSSFFFPGWQKVL